MKRYISVIFILILVVSSLGCLDSPEPPGADIPRLIVDYDEGPNETFDTIIHVRGMEPVRYENLTLYLNGTQIIRQNSFSIEHRTNRSKFKLEVNATRKEKRYNFKGNLTARPEVEENDHGDEVIFKLTYHDDQELKEEYLEEADLPFQKALNQVKEEEET
ncbi:MAG: hypothetical protein ACOC87_02420 [Candidatus Natronoplasma sp.]